MHQHKLLFSIVTTCRNEIESLPRWKQNVLDQTRSPNEIVVVDAFSNDGTYEYLQEWSANDNRVIVIQEKCAVAKGRNIAIENSNHDYILSTDMGVRLNNVWCEELIRPFEKDNSIKVVAGNTCIDVDTIKSKVGKAEFYLENGGFATLTDGHVPGNRSIAYKKEIWKEVGKLPEDLTFAADDSVLGRQLIQRKYKFAYAPEAMTYWGRPEKLSQFYHEGFVYGKGDGEAFIKTPRAFKWYKNGNLPRKLVPYFSLLINLVKRSTWKGFVRALRKGEIGTAFIIPILAVGKSFHHSRGYLIGYETGNTKCLECRNRLERDSMGYSLL